MGYKASNNADTTLSESITTTSTAINVATGHGDDFPTLGASDWTLITITDKNGAREIIKIIARTGDTMTVGTTPGGEADVRGRAQEGTEALSITYTDDHSVRCCPTAGLIEAMADYSDQGDLTATPAEIEAVCKGNTATAAELSQLHESGVVKADLENLHESGVVKADLEKLHAITLSAVEANLLDADNRTIGDILTKTSGGTMGAIAAVAAGNYLKSAGEAALPSYGKLSLADTGVYVHSGEYVNDTAADTVTTGFRPSLVICVAIGAKTIGERGWSFGAYDRIQNINRYIYRNPDGSSGTGTVLFNIPSCGGGFVNSTSATGYTVSYNVAERVYFVQISFP